MVQEVRDLGPDSVAESGAKSSANSGTVQKPLKSAAMPRPSVSDRLIHAARKAADLRAAALADPELARAVALVKAWQAYRLSHTHADLLQSPRYRAAARFFVDDLYGSGSLAQRDAELARVIPTLTRFLPDGALTTICEAIELDALSESLDHRVARQLMAAPPDPHKFDRAAYAQAYRQAGGFDERNEQITAAERIGASLDKLVRKPLLGGLLNTMRGPARAAGLISIHEFLVRGFTAFKSMSGAREFLQLTLGRERAIAQALEVGDSSQLPI